MAVVIVVSVLLAAILLWALYTEQVPAEEPRPVLPAWESLPTSADIAKADFPLAALGYDRRVVEAHLRRVAAAYDTVIQARTQLSGEESPPPRPVERDDSGSTAPPPPPAAG